MKPGYRSLGVVLVALTLIMVVGCATAARSRSVRSTQSGVASYYAHKFHGRPTASGERFDMNRMTAAHRTLPFGTNVRVTNLTNGRAVTVRVNDRGPFAKGRVIDLSYAAAKKLDMVKAGVVNVKLEVLGAPTASAN